ncbi:Serpentine type 7TM GPCR chemoreceptor Srt [Globodera pallida]|nr:Serpentine type 7TM GPCR chemoreceptor Srt [Globodera pallida]
MELFFFRHAEYERLYNCTGLDIDSIPLERRQFVPESIAVCVLCAIYYVLYVPCIYSIWKHMRDNSCYKLLFFVGITDLGILWILGFFSGWANLRGDVFCSYPTLMYFVGMAVTGFPPVIYLALNKTIREDCRLLYAKLFQRHRIGHIGGVTVFRPETNPPNGVRSII